MTDLPKVISVDDHVVEPAHVWQDRLPSKMREQGPRVERARWGDFAISRQTRSPRAQPHSRRTAASWFERISSSA